MSRMKSMQAGETFAYRTYLVKRLLLGEYLIEKDAHYIAIVRSQDEAQAAIDGLVTTVAPFFDPAWYPKGKS